MTIRRLGLAPGSLPLPAGWRRHGFDWVRGSAAGLVPLALLVGAGAGAGAVLFRYLILWVTELATGRSDFSFAGRVGSPHFPGLGAAFVVVVPVIGGLTYGPLIDRFAKEARGHGVPEVMLAVAEKGGRIGPAVAAVKSLASALCIGTGGSVGREGPIVQIGSALGSTIGQRLRLPESRLRLMVACGAAGGIAATFNAPIAGVFFALELILRDFAAESFGVVVLASVTADVIGRAAFGDQPFLALPGFHLVSGWDYLLYATLGLLAAVIGVGFIRVLYGLEDAFDRWWPGPMWSRPATGGLLLGVLLLGLPEMYGVGYPVLEAGIRGHYSGGFLLLLLAGKLAAVSLTIAIGGSGGVFAPSLFMGAMLGTAFGDLTHALFPGVAGPAGAYGLIGMGAVFAGAARAPITAVLIIFELTGDYTIVLPLMAAIVLAAGLSNLVSRDTIYTLKLRRRGIDIMRGRAANLMAVLRVADAMQPVPRALDQRTSLAEIIDVFDAEGRDALPVVDDHGAYRGTVTSAEVEASARDNTLDATAADLAVAIPTIRADQTLEQALNLLVSNDRSGLPVVASDGGPVTGWLTHRDVLTAYSRRVHQGVAQIHDQPSAATAPTIAAPPRAPRRLGELQGYRIIDLELTRDAPPVGQRVGDVDWPRSSLLLGIRRNGGTLAPDEDTRLERNDRLTLLVRADTADRFVELVEDLASAADRDR
ncbi:MAG TPA: chloride channel protein [Mycobacteriales bacterium]|nr:chloride channel protein [Mycobacteriales bacterium]